MKQGHEITEGSGRGSAVLIGTGVALIAVLGAWVAWSGPGSAEVAHHQQAGSGGVQSASLPAGATRGSQVFSMESDGATPGAVEPAREEKKSDVTGTNRPPMKPYIAPIGRSPIPTAEEGTARWVTVPRRDGLPLDAARWPRDPGEAVEQVSGVVTWQQAARMIGKRVTVEGRIVRTSNTGKICFLNFSTDRDAPFYLVVFPDGFGLWPQPPEKQFMDRNIRVSGLVEEHRGRAQIKVTKADQVEFLP